MVVSTVDSATANLTYTQINPTTYEYTITLTNTAASASIATFWFAWDDVPDVNFMTVSPNIVTMPTNWFGLITHNFGATPDGYGIQFYTPFAGSNLTPSHSLTFVFRSSETPTQMLGASPYEPAFNTLASFVYPNWPPTIGDANAANFVVACFAQGTLIATPRGEIAVENLSEGDVVSTIGGASQKVRWVGVRHLSCTAHPRRNDILPIRVRRDAIAAGRPARDLLLSPDHAVFLDGVLVPVRHLVNGASIVQEDVKSVTYFHIELAAHDVVLANGLECESYLDTGNRAAFSNGDMGAVSLVPDFIGAGWDNAYATRGCAPLCVGGPALAAIRSRLSARAEAEFGLVWSDEPDAALEYVAGMTEMVDEGALLWADSLSAGPMRLRSRAARPALIDEHSTDGRMLGLCVSHLVIRADGREQVILASDTLLDGVAGWHGAEHDEAGHCWRWTDGLAELPGSLFDGIGDATHLALRVGIAGRMIYPESRRELTAEAA